MTDVTQLLPCPFCGSPPEAEQGVIQGVVRCGAHPCSARQSAPTVKGAAAKWNTRAQSGVVTEDAVERVVRVDPQDMELVKQLRRIGPINRRLLDEAADRLEALAASDQSLRENLQACRRNVYRLQVGGERLCAALRAIAGGCDESSEIARTALDRKEPDPDWSQPALTKGTPDVRG